jgi:hypothetical protein|tara:strand:- start:17 stop:181 length:165 start_codon:yes stop_codon:yes gene_type:complete
MTSVDFQMCQVDKSVYLSTDRVFRFFIIAAAQPIITTDASLPPNARPRAIADDG